MLVICLIFFSDGVGCTGVFCALSVVLHSLEESQMVDVFQAVKSLRMVRPGMVETKVGIYNMCLYVVAFVASGWYFKVLFLQMVLFFRVTSYTLSMKVQSLKDFTI